MIIPMNPKAEYLFLKKEIDNAIFNVLKSGNYILGDEVIKFEKEFSLFTKSKYSVSVASGSDALYFSLLAGGIKKDDEVIVPSFTATATVAAIVQAGAKPVFAEIDPYTYTIDSKMIKNYITKKTRAIIPVHLYGNSADILSIRKIAKKFNLILIEDCAQAFGTKNMNKQVGLFGDFGAFSFYPTKNLGCIGDGGMIITQNKKAYNRLLLLRQYGWKKRYISSIHGWNSRLDEIQAAILRIKLKNVSLFLNKRKEISEYYLRNIKNSKIQLPITEKNVNHSYNIFVIKCKQRNELQKYLLNNGIGTMIHYPVPVHLNPAYKSFGNKTDLANTEKISKEILSLPIHVGLTKSEQDKIISLINKF